MFELDCNLQIIVHLKKFLNQMEQQKVERFYFTRDRNSYVVARGLLRLILGLYLDESPANVKFDYGAQGKPALAEQHISSIKFNLSHSKNIALFAFSCNRDLGVDVEYHRYLSDWHGIAKHFFAPSEQSALNKIPPEHQQHAFFDCWTRKEAFIKALGGGLSIPLDQFEVSLAPNQPASLLSVEGKTENSKRWSMVGLDTQSDYSAALVVEGPPPKIHTWLTSIESLLSHYFRDLSN
ncbi:MAG: 4'-phosphopantetheinyl transferase superfamily protein [Synechococcus sp.]